MHSFGVLSEHLTSEAIQTAGEEEEVRGSVGSRLNGEMTREQQRQAVANLDGAHEYITSLNQAVNEHQDGKRIMARAAEIRTNPVGARRSEGKGQ